MGQCQQAESHGTDFQKGSAFAGGADARIADSVNDNKPVDKGALQVSCRISRKKAVQHGVFMENRRHPRRKRRNNALNDHCCHNCHKNGEKQPADAFDHFTLTGDKEIGCQIDGAVKAKFRSAAEIPPCKLQQGRPHGRRNTGHHKERAENQDHQHHHGQSEFRGSSADQREKITASFYQRQIAHVRQQNA